MLTENTLSNFTLESLFDLMILKLDEFQKVETRQMDFKLRALQREEIELIQQVINKRKGLMNVQPAPANTGVFA